MAASSALDGRRFPKSASQMSLAGGKGSGPRCWRWTILVLLVLPAALGFYRAQFVSFAPGDGQRAAQDSTWSSEVDVSREEQHHEQQGLGSWERKRAAAEDQGGRGTFHPQGVRGGGGRGQGESGHREEGVPPSSTATSPSPRVTLLDGSEDSVAEIDDVPSFGMDDEPSGAGGSLQSPHEARNADQGARAHPGGERVAPGAGEGGSSRVPVLRSSRPRHHQPGADSSGVETRAHSSSPSPASTHQESSAEDVDTISGTVIGGESHRAPRWFDSSSRCHSGESQSHKFTLRLWAGMDAAHIRFRVGGPFLEDEKKLVESAAPNATDRPPQRPSARWPNTPLLMHLKQFMVYNRTAGRMQMRDWVQVRGTAFRMHFDPVFLGMLPTNDRMWRYDTCAVVGNSGSMLRTTYGSQIDSHSAVFRINYAPTRSFEKHVGSHTTFDIVNQQHTKAFLPNIEAGGHLPTAKRAHYRQSVLTVFEVDKEFARRHLYAPLMKRFNGHSRQHGNVAILSPDFVYHAHKVWKVMKALVENASTGTKHFMSKPMSGFFAVIFALQICEKVTLYGFSPYKKGDMKYHYFDQGTCTDQMIFQIIYELIGYRTL